MRSDLVRRLEAAERRFGKDHPAALSDQELLAALDDRRMAKRELNTLYQRIQEPFGQTMITVAASLRRDPAQRALLEPLYTGPLGRRALALSYASDDEIPGPMWRDSGEPMPLPSRDARHPIMWGLWVRGWMGHLLFQHRGKEELRECVSQQAASGEGWRVTTLDSAEATRILEFLRPLESLFSRLDMAFLICGDGDGHFFTSGPSVHWTQVDKARQWWTQLV